MQTESKEAAMFALKVADYDAAVIYCYKSKKFYVEEGEGGMIRLFEVLIALKSQGRITIEGTEERA